MIQIRLNNRQLPENNCLGVTIFSIQINKEWKQMFSLYKNIIAHLLQKFNIVYNSTLSLIVYSLIRDGADVRG